MQHDIHFWIGSESSQDESTAAAMLAVELDGALGKQGKDAAISRCVPARPCTTNGGALDKRWRVSVMLCGSIR